MAKNKEQKGLYSSPAVEVFRLGSLLSILDSVSNLSTDFVNVLDGEDEDQF